MNIAIGLVIVILLISVVGTLVIAGKSDDNYQKNTKRNTWNLTAIYIITITLALIAVGVYIRWYS